MYKTAEFTINDALKELNRIQSMPREQQLQELSKRPRYQTTLPGINLPDPLEAGKPWPKSDNTPVMHSSDTVWNPQLRRLEARDPEWVAWENGLQQPGVWKNVADTVVNRLLPGDDGVPPLVKDLGTFSTHSAGKALSAVPHFIGGVQDLVNAGVNSVAPQGSWVYNMTSTPSYMTRFGNWIDRGRESLLGKEQYTPEMERATLGGKRGGDFMRSLSGFTGDTLGFAGVNKGIQVGINGAKKQTFRWLFGDNPYAPAQPYERLATFNKNHPYISKLVGLPQKPSGDAYNKAVRIGRKRNQMQVDRLQPVKFKDLRKELGIPGNIVSNQISPITQRYANHPFMSPILGHADKSGRLRPLLPGESASFSRPFVIASTYDGTGREIYDTIGKTLANSEGANLGFFPEFFKSMPSRHSIKHWQPGMGNAAEQKIKRTLLSNFDNIEKYRNTAAGYSRVVPTDSVRHELGHVKDFISRLDYNTSGNIGVSPISFKHFDSPIEQASNQQSWQKALQYVLWPKSHPLVQRELRADANAFGKKSF